MVQAAAYAAIQTTTFGELVNLLSPFGFRPIPSILYGVYAVDPFSPHSHDRIETKDAGELVRLAGDFSYFDTELGGNEYFGGNFEDRFTIECQHAPPELGGWDQLAILGSASQIPDRPFFPNFAELAVAISFCLPVCPIMVLDSRDVDPHKYLQVVNRESVELNVYDNPAVLIVDRGFADYVTTTGEVESFMHRSKVVFVVEEWLEEIKRVVLSSIR